MSTALCAEVRPAAKVLEVAVGVVADQDHVPPMPAVAAVGPALGDVSLPPEAHATVAATARENLDSSLVFHLYVSVSGLL
jgi:hypothetical protein